MGRRGRSGGRSRGSRGRSSGRRSRGGFGGGGRRGSSNRGRRGSLNNRKGRNRRRGVRRGRGFYGGTGCGNLVTGIALIIFGIIMCVIGFSNGQLPNILFGGILLILGIASLARSVFPF